FAIRCGGGERPEHAQQIFLTLWPRAEGLRGTKPNWMLVGTRSWRIGKCNRASERPGTGKQAVRVALQSAVPIYGEWHKRYDRPLGKKDDGKDGL
ncbi:unnamed protein product, partial [Symbiodinium sp. KB8]